MIPPLPNPMPEAPAPPPPPPPPPPMATQSELGDYKLYTLPEPTTVAANQTKQVRFLDQSGAPYRRIYRYSVGAPLLDALRRPHLLRQPQGAIITLKLVNEAAQGLGKPLPSGHVVVMTAARGQQMFAGGDQIEDTPTGADLALALGRSPLVSVQPEIVSAFKTPDARQAYDLAVTVANAGRDAALVEVRQGGNPYLKVRTEDRPHTLQDGDLCWTVTVPPGGRVMLHYSLVAAG